MGKTRIIVGGASKQAAAKAENQKDIGHHLVLEGDDIIHYTQHLLKENKELKKIQAQKKIKKEARPKSTKPPTEKQLQTREGFGSVAGEAKAIYNAQGRNKGPKTWREIVREVSKKRKVDQHNKAQVEFDYSIPLEDATIKAALAQNMEEA